MCPRIFPFTLIFPGIISLLSLGHSARFISHKFIDITRTVYHQKFQKEIEAGMNFPFLKNINQALTPLIRSSCCIHLTSFNQSPFDFLEPPEHPLILRHLTSPIIVGTINHRLIHMPNFVCSERVNRLTWIASGLKLEEMVNAYKANCYNSHLDVGGNSGFTSFCIKLTFQTFPIITKPRYCEAYVAAYPPLLTLQFITLYMELQYHGVWQYHELSNRFLPTKISKFHVLFINTKLLSIIWKSLLDHVSDIPSSGQWLTMT